MTEDNRFMWMGLIGSSILMIMTLIQSGRIEVAVFGFFFMFIPFAVLDYVVESWRKKHVK